MKISIYFDVYPWTRSIGDVFPTMLPGTKPDNAKRYCVDVVIPDPAEPDLVTEGEAKEVDE